MIHNPDCSFVDLSDTKFYILSHNTSQFDHQGAADVTILNSLLFDWRKGFADVLVQKEEL